MFVKEGLQGVVADPFGSSMCLILAGFFSAPRLYRLNLLTVGDYYRVRYDCSIEVLCTLCVVASYLGWVAAQFKVWGLVLNVVTDGGVSQSVGIVIGAAIVLTYTTFGGMFSVAILDCVSISVIMEGGSGYALGLDSVPRRLDDDDVGGRSLSKIFSNGPPLQRMNGRPYGDRC